MAENIKVNKVKSFNAVDLITIVVFAVIFRVLFYLFKLLGVVYPFNHTFLYFTIAFTLSAGLVIVSKRWTTILFTIAWVAINFFIQGEIPLYWLAVIILPILPETFFAVRSKSKNFESPSGIFSSLKDVIIGTYLYSIVYFVFNFTAIITVFRIPTPINLLIIVFILSLITIFVGSYLGYKAGDKIKGLIG